MGWIKDRATSPAMAVAVVALVAAVAGTAIAGPEATPSALSKSKVKKIVRKQINKLAPDLSVASADTANAANSAKTAGSANTAASAKTAGSANTAASANPIAFAHVGSDGEVIESQSKNVADANVSHAANGVYCFHGLGFAFKGAVVTADQRDTPLDNRRVAIFALGDALSDGCPSGTPAYVHTFQTIDGVTADNGFFIVFYN